MSAQNMFTGIHITNQDKYERTIFRLIGVHVQRMYAGASDVYRDTSCNLFQVRSGQAISSQQIFQS